MIAEITMYKLICSSLTTVGAMNPLMLNTPLMIMSQLFAGDDYDTEVDRNLKEEIANRILEDPYPLFKGCLSPNEKQVGNYYQYTRVSQKLMKRRFSFSLLAIVHDQRTE